MRYKGKPDVPFANSASGWSVSGIGGVFLEGVKHWDWMVTISFRDQLWDGRLRTPTRGWAVRKVKRYFQAMERAAGGRIAYVMVEDLGKVSDRIHAHILVAGVADLDRRLWWAKAFREFGRTTIEPYVEHGGGAQYTARPMASNSSEIHFGGKMLNSGIVPEKPPIGRAVVARSADVPSELFKMGRARGGRR
jgi:hypothetical protein